MYDISLFKFLQKDVKKYLEQEKKRFDENERYENKIKKIEEENEAKRKEEVRHFFKSCVERKNNEEGRIKVKEERRCQAKRKTNGKGV